MPIERFDELYARERDPRDFSTRWCMHGTNLAASMAAYLAVCGFPEVTSGEDHALWAALIAADCWPIVTPLAPATTSGRRYRPSPAGVADLLTRIDDVPA